MPFLLVSQSAITAATPWLASVAGIFALMALAARLIERKPRCEAIAQFRRMGLFGQVFIVRPVGPVTRWAGAKGDRGGGTSPPEPNVVRGGVIDVGGGQTRDGPGYVPLSATDTPAFSNLAFRAITASSTNIALAATWTTITNREEAIDVYMRTNLTAGTWGRLAEVAIDTATQGVAFDVPAEWLDGASAAFFRLGSRLDSDGDGLPNDYETLVCGTNPSLVDTDGDGLEDGEELSIGTNPAISDTDDDGMPDGTEVSGLVATDGTVLWMNIATAPNRTIVFTNADDEVAQVVLPFEVRIPGIASSNLSICANGLLALADHSPALADGHYSNKSASNIPLGAAPSATIAAFWDDLAVNPEMGSCVSFATIGGPGFRTAILEFLNIGFYDGTTNDFVSFQVQIPESEPSVIRVVFYECQGLGYGSSATIGARTSRGDVLEFARNVSGAVFDGLTVTFRFGFGVDPLLADTDDDGLADGDEVLVWHTDPYLSDSDDDLLPDGFEILCGFSPTIHNDDDSDLGNETDFDYDGDGLDYLDEYLNGTSPFNADTDGDDVGDAAEVQNGSDPLNAADGGRPPSMSEVLQVPFHIYGDYAAWEMRIVGQGPDDWRTYRISTHRPGDASSVAKALRKGNTYEISMVWNGSGEYANPYWYCWEAQIDDLPDGRTFNDYSASRRPNVFNTVVGDGWWAENEDGLLTAHVHTCDGEAGNLAKRRKAHLHVLRTTVEIATNRLDDWIEIAQDKVVMSDENLRIRIKVEPKVPSFDVLMQALGDTYTIYTDTAPNGVEIAFSANDEFLQEETWSEVHITKTRQQLRDLGLLPSTEEDGVDEKATLDNGDDDPTHNSNLTDSTAFNAIAAESRHDATQYGDMDAAPPSSPVSKWFFKSAGVEYVRVDYGGVESHSRQIMDQADYFYCSGHGNHRMATIHCTPTESVGPSEIGSYWRDDLDCVVFAGCSIMDVEDFVAQRLTKTDFSKWEKAGGACSPGKQWRSLGPTYLLGYGWFAPLDKQGATAIATSFASQITSGKNPIEAWRIANDLSAGRNACAIDLSSTPAKFRYWKRVGWKSYTWDCKTEGVDW